MSDHNCLFCKIIAGEIPATIVHQDERCVTIRDINPQAPTHLLVMPRAHIVSLNDVQPEDEPLLGRLFNVAAGLARERGLDTKGYRAVINNGATRACTAY